MTLKAETMLWSISIGKGFSTEPLTLQGFYVNTVFGDQFWVNEQERYPKRLLWFLQQSTNFHVFHGQDS